MRTVDYIDGYEDVYQPVPEEDIATVEKELDCILPEGLKEMYRNPNIELITKLPDMLWPIHHSSLGIIERNRWLRDSGYHDFPPALIVFASGGCGDYWVINKAGNSILYIDPDESIEANLMSTGFPTLKFDNYSLWLKYELRPRD